MSNQTPPRMRRTSCLKQSDIRNSKQCNSKTPLNLRSALSIGREPDTHPDFRVHALEVLDLITLQTGGAETNHAGSQQQVLRGKQTWWCRVESDPLTRADAEVYR
ncbi:hypothetical protein Tco_1094470 [Tanacetum coccineum]|uniref:Uncharacterized protein n=1 Tax=Tanacetum coccineum TaxID=301880 RepID=A0ABQ5IHN3_9ASTR